MITEQYIIEKTFSTFDNIVNSVLGVTPSINLVNVDVRNMSPLGSAVSDGTIRINKSYVGTSSHEMLMDTIKHEIAHLVVGFEAGHGPVWQTCCIAIGCNPNPTTRVEDTEFLKNNYNHALMAEFMDGTVKLLKYYKRRSKKYIDAIPGQYSTGDGVIKRLYYEPISIIDKV